MRSATRLFFVLLLCVGACKREHSSNEAAMRSGMASPMRYDDEPIRIMIGHVKMTVPANCFDSPLEPTGADVNGATPVDGMLVVLALPNMACRTHQNRDVFQEIGPYFHHVTVLVNTHGNKLSPDAFLRLEREQAINGPQLSSALIWKSSIGNWEVTRYSSVFLGKPGERVVYDAKDKNAFTVCNHRQNPVDTCTTNLFTPQLNVKIDFAGGYENNQNSIYQAVRQWLNKRTMDDGGTQ